MKFLDIKTWECICQPWNNLKTGENGSCGEKKKIKKGMGYKNTSIPQHLLSLRVWEELYYLGHLSLVLPGILSKLYPFQSEKKNTSQQV